MSTIDATMRRLTLEDMLETDRIVFTNGCFDIIHIGHIRLLEYCAQFGKVVVGLNSDSSVRKLKGAGRPVNSQEDRMEILNSIRFVHDVVIFDELTPKNLIERTMPDIIVKGGDYEIDEVVGREFAEVKIFPTVSGKSTTNLISAQNGLEI